MKPNLIDLYKRLANQNSIEINVVEPVVEEKETIEPVIIEPVIIEPAPVVKVKKETKESTLPRRYGKVKILEDIKEQGGKATNQQLTALAINDLKNMYVNLSNRLIKDMLLEDKVLTDEDMRDIRSAIKIVESKLKHILKKK